MTRPGRTPERVIPWNVASLATGRSGGRSCPRSSRRAYPPTTCVGGMAVGGTSVGRSAVPGLADILIAEETARPDADVLAEVQTHI